MPSRIRSQFSARLSDHRDAFGVTFLAACLTRTTSFNLTPVFGAVPFSERTPATFACVGTFAAVIVILSYRDDGLSMLAADASLFAVSSIPLITYYARYAWSALGLDAQWVINFLLLLTLLPCLQMAIQLGFDASPSRRQRSALKPRPSSNLISPTGASYICMICLWFFSTEIILGRSIEYLAFEWTNLYLFLANSVLSRDLMQIWICLILSTVRTGRLQRPRNWALRLSATLWILTLLRRCMQPGNHGDGYHLLEWHESNTGYVSVFENTKGGYRALRNDHSLLGGQWLIHKRPHWLPIKVPESIFSVFYMLEAVRLITPDQSARKSLARMIDEPNPRALAIGLGIGTSPSALASHGIDTTAVEIDPIVTHYAKMWFHLHPNVSNINQDALTYVDQALSHDKKYHYIIHDVFTGGVEPEALFTDHFLNQLYNLLSPKGIVAINYAGDLTATGTSEVIIRIVDAFINCRIFRDSPAPSSIPPSHGPHTPDFANIVVFCARMDGSWHFRSPAEADFLGSEARREQLLPRYELDAEVHRDRLKRFAGVKRDQRRERLESAVQHWRIMRALLPDVFWENW